MMRSRCLRHVQCLAGVLALVCGCLRVACAQQPPARRSATPGETAEILRAAADTLRRELSAAFDFAIDPRVFSLTFTPGRPWPSVSKTGKHDDAVLVALSDVHGARVIPLQIIERCVVARPPAVCTSAPLMIIMSASVPE